ncbi:MAG: hypothetical protein P4L82_19225 [Ancalomicrobiaceae bacterium]|nr:hypothetical protein [Ancalomicrobiaceae bacterium]
MIAIRDIEEALAGCWRIAFGDATATRHFDLTADGFWRSFRLAGILAACDAVDATVGHFAGFDGSTEDAGLGAAIWVFIVAGITSLITFCAFPLVVAGAARPMGLAARYAPYVTVRNWLAFFLSFPIYLLNAITYAGWLPIDVIGLFVLSFEVVVLLAGYSVARVVLGAPQSIAVGLSLMDFLLALVIAKLVTMLLF